MYLELYTLSKYVTIKTKIIDEALYTMKKIGFTIVEILIVLGVLGAIAALTLPTLATANQNRINSSALSVAVSNMETALRTMIHSEDANDLTDTRAWIESNNLGNANAFKGYFGQYLELSAVVSSNNIYEGITIKGVDSNNANAALALINDNDAYVSDSGVVYIFNVLENNSNITEQQAMNDGMTLSSAVADLVIDVNGSKKPNKIGRDIFFFKIGSDGVLYPYGSGDVEYIVSNGANSNSDWNSANAIYACTDNAKSNDGMGCTARLVDNGYKMDY